MKLLCLVLSHDWLYWREDANCRFCRRCGKWEHIDPFNKRRPFEWVLCEDPRPTIAKGNL